MKYLVLVQARCGSSRLPNKILKDLCGVTTLQRVIERVKKSQYVDEVIVITSIEKQNLAVVKLCAELDTRVFIGSEEDVLDRYYQAARLLSPEYVIRVTGDCPVFDSGLLDEAILSLKPDTDYLAMLSETFPDGLDLEIMKFSALKTAWENATLKSEREHVTMYIKNHQDNFKLQDFVCKIPDIHNIRLTLDGNEDYELLYKIYAHFHNIHQPDFNYIDIINFLNDNPELKQINQKYARNEGLAKSLQNDFVINN